MSEKNIKPEIIITDIYEAISRVEKEPDNYRIISISSKDLSVSPINVKKRLTKVLKAEKEVLYLEFDDVTENMAKFSDEFVLASEADCIKALEFLEKGGSCLVHCRAGISRSTAIVLGYLLKAYPTYQEAINKLFEIRPCAIPNSHILKLMCKILGKEKDYEAIVKYLGDNGPMSFCYHKQL